MQHLPSLVGLQKPSLEGKSDEQIEINILGNVGEGLEIKKIGANRAKMKVPMN